MHIVLLVLQLVLLEFIGVLLALHWAEHVRRNPTTSEWRAIWRGSLFWILLSSGFWIPLVDIYI